MDDDLNALFDGDPERDADEGYDQDGPDLFGAEPDELILPTEPVPVPDPEMDIDLDEMSEIPIDPDDVEDAESDDAADADVAPLLTLPPSASGPAVSRPETPLALYRRYRPDTFADVIGQEHVTEPLQRALVNNRVNHAYLFSGPRGCGKTTSARILARCLNCEQGPTPTPCGECRSCRDLARGGSGSIDVIEMDAASHGLVEDARALRESAFFNPVHSRFKIYIIDEAHMVTTHGFNALLKVVEEPPAHVKFIFATTEPEKVLGTIRSRTHHYPFRLVPPRTLSAYLGRLCAEEGVDVDPAVLPLVVRAGAGSVRDSLSVLDQLLGGAAHGGVTYRQAAALLGYTPDTLLDEIMDAFAAGDSAGVFACIDKVLDVGQDPRRFAEDLLRRLRDLIIVAAVPDALSSGLVDVAADQAERLTTQARGLGAGELTRAAEVIAKGLTDMRGTTAPRLHLELMCARVLLPGADVDARGVHARLDRLERRLGVLDGGAGATPPDAAPARPAAVSTPAQAPPPPAPASGWYVEPVVPGGGGRPDDRDAPGAPPAARRPDRVERRHPSEIPDRPAPPPAAQPVASPAAAAPGAPAPVDPTTLDTAGLRTLWPQVLEAVKNRRRVTWIALQQNTQVQHLADGVLTLTVDNPGALETLQRGGSDDIIREAVLAVAGVAPTIKVLAADALGGTPAPPAAPAPGVQQEAAPRSDAAAPQSAPATAARAAASADRARRQLQDTHVGGVPEPEEEPDRDDPDVDPAGVEPDELLTTFLGAEYLGEEEPPGR